MSLNNLLRIALDICSFHSSQQAYLEISLQNLFEKFLSIH